MRKRALMACVALAAFAAACSPPKYASYASVFGDYKVSVPWGWQVVADADGPAFTEVRFIGNFDKDFYLGAPSLSVRWYRNYRPHTLRDGSLEMYANAGDFIAQTLKQVYGEKKILYGGTMREDGGRDFIDEPVDLPLKGSGLTAKFFIVLSPTRAPADKQWGLEVDENNKPINMRMHAYAVLPMEGGFYVLCYPATRRGFDRYFDRFREVLGTFKPVTEGPGGAKLGRKPLS